MHCLDHTCPSPLASAGATSSVVRSRWLRDLFEGADKDSSGTLTVKEVMSLMDTLNVGVSMKIVKRMFKVCLRLLMREYEVTERVQG